jgi:hypothetical protein
MQSVSSQFSLRSLLRTVVTVSMLLAYVRLFGTAAFAPAGVGLAFALVVGAVLGIYSQRRMESVTWALVGYAMALCCALSAVRLSEAQLYYWILLGGMAGGVAGAVPIYQLRTRLLLAVLLAAVWVPMGIFITTDGPPLDAVLSVAVIAGLLLLAEVVGRDQQHHRIALDAWAAGIVLAVIVGNFLAIGVRNTFYA